jgi:hypothetical protein
VRGGAWNRPGYDELRASFRYGEEGNEHGLDIGFRVATTVPEPSTLTIVVFAGLSLIWRRRTRLIA